jgi:hypothetical protein
VYHAQFDNVSSSMQDSIKFLFDPNKPYLTIWVWIFDPEEPMRWRPLRPLKPCGTPLHYAAIYGMCDVARFLVLERSQGVNVRRSSDSRTPLFLAAECGHPEVTRTLLDYGANKNARDRDGMTPLHVASESGHPEVVQMLLDHGTDASARDKYYRTPLHSLSQKVYQSVDQNALDLGVDANAGTAHLGQLKGKTWTMGKLLSSFSSGAQIRMHKIITATLHCIWH